MDNHNRHTQKRQIVVIYSSPANSREDSHWGKPSENNYQQKDTKIHKQQF